MNKNLFYLLISGITGVSAAVALISNVGVDALRFRALRADSNPFLLTLDNNNAAVTNDDFSETTVTYGDASKATQILYSSAKKLDNGLCILANGATIQKANSAPSYGLSTFAASGEGELEIKTYFNDPNGVESPYIYNYTLGENERTTQIVGNYFVVKAVGGDANIKTLKFGYGCNESAAAVAETGIHITNQDNYAELFRGSDNKVRLNVELEANTLDLSTFDFNRITLRSSDNYDNYTIACYNLANRGGGYPNTKRVAQFNLSDLNDKTGNWTQFTYTAKIYVDGKRIDGTTNGNIYVDEKTINTTYVQRDIEDDSQATSGFQLGLDTTNKVSTISWTNTIEDESASFSNKGLRFVKMGTNGDTEYKHGLSNAGDTCMYYNLYGWVATEEEALEVAKNYSRYSLRNATPVSQFDFVGNSVPNRCTYSAADGGYQVKLSFDLSGLRGSIEEAGGYKKGDIIAGLYYDNIPYMYRDGNNTSGLRTTYSLNKTESVELGYNWYVTHVDIFYQWIKLYAIHA